MLNPAALRAMRGAMGWSLRDLAAESGVALGTVMTMEKGLPVSARSRRRVLDAFRTQGVTLKMDGMHAVVRIGAAVHHVPPELRGLPYVAVRRKADGTSTVVFEVPPRSRPGGWLSTQPLPIHGRTGRLDPVEVAAIKADAARLLAELYAARSEAREDRRKATANAR